MSLETQLQQWTEANLIDSVTAQKILQFEQAGGNKRLRWPVILAISFGALMLCAGVLLFVAAHWDHLSPPQRFLLVLAMVGTFHVAGAAAGTRVPAVGTALHSAGTVALGAGVFLAGQIFNLEEHWPSGVLLWGIGAALAWLILRQWPQAALVAVLVPWWLGGEWAVATERFHGAWNIAAQGFLLLAIFYLTTPWKETNKHLRVALMWFGSFAVTPFIADVALTGDINRWWYYRQNPLLPSSTALVGYAAAYLPILVLAWIARRKESVPMVLSAFWVAVLGIFSHQPGAENHVWLYLWTAAGAFGLCWWGVRDNRKLLINYGTAVFAITLIAFYFSQVLDKLGRSMGLIMLGVLFLAGGWILHRLRSDLIARAAAMTGGHA